MDKEIIKKFHNRIEMVLAECKANRRRDEQAWKAVEHEKRDEDAADRFCNFIEATNFMKDGDLPAAIETLRDNYEVAKGLVRLIRVNERDEKVCALTEAGLLQGKIKH
jgi:hypothetical protein